MDTGFITRRSQWPGARIQGDRAAVSFEDGEAWSHDALRQRVNTAANGLLARGIGHGDRVGILLYNTLDYWALYFATGRIGAIAVRLNFRLTAEELVFAINDSGCRMLCFHTSLAPTIESVRPDVQVEQYVGLADDHTPLPTWVEPVSVLTSGASDEPACPRPAPHDPAMLMYTSGTTGRPKGALWNHANALWFTAMQAMQWHLDENCVAMTTGPMYHVGAVEDLTSAALAVGGHAVVLRSGGFSIRRVLEIIQQQRVTDLFLFPFMIYDLAQLDADEAAAYNMDSMRRILCGGDPLLPWATDVLRQRYPWIEVIQVFGLTEGTPIAAASTGAETLSHPESVGHPMPFTEITLRDDQGEMVGPGEEGEIWIRSPVVCEYYWNRPEATAETFVDGWCRTGDLGRFTNDGLLCIAGRQKDMIRTGGENVYPAEVEDVLMRHPGIREVAVIAVPDPRLIETVCAVVVPAADADIDGQALVQHCRQSLAGYKCPRHVVFAESLPRTPSGKLMKYKLRETHRSLGSEPGG
mgnify:CR=1 FL=1